MNPNGFVAAASMTSQTSRPIRSHSSASWLTKAMLTLRKTFSSSLASSAASGERQLDDLVVDVPRAGRAARRRGRRGRRADQARDVARGAGRVARVDPLGREGEVEVAPGAQAAALERLAERAGRGAREGRRLEDDRAGPAGAGRTISSAADRTGPRSGSLVVVIGVGTHTKIASAVGEVGLVRSDDPEAAAEAASRGARRRCRRSASDPRRSSLTRAGAGVDARRRPARPRESRERAAARRSRAR